MEEEDDLYKMSIEPECAEATDDEDAECEFEVKDDSWWCNTHNCYA